MFLDPPIAVFASTSSFSCIDTRSIHRFILAMDTQQETIMCVARVLKEQGQAKSEVLDLAFLFCGLFDDLRTIFWLAI
jgi:hypothetical protein